MRKQWRDAAVLFTAFAIVAAMTGCGRADEDASVETGTPKGPITVGSKIDTEGELISSLIKLVLENAGFEVVDKSQTGTTEVVRKSIIAGEIDLYPEYSGNGHWFFFDDLTSEEKAGYKNGQVGYDTTARIDLEQNGIVWLEPIRANNTWALAVREEFARAEGLKTMSDFAAYVNAGKPVKVAASDEFFTSAGTLSSKRCTGTRWPRTRSSASLAVTPPPLRKQSRKGRMASTSVWLTAPTARWQTSDS